MSLQLVKLVSPIEIVETPMSPADRVAAGFPLTIWGYRSEEGVYDDTTLADIAAAQAAGWPDYAIWVNVRGTVRPAGGSGAFTLPSISLQPVVVAVSLLGAQSGVFALPGVSVQPVVAAVDITGQSGASFLMPAVSLQPVVAAPTLVGSTSGAFALPPISTQPVVLAPLLSSASVGSFAMPAVSVQPVVAAPSLAASAGGSFYTTGFTGATNGATTHDSWSAYGADLYASQVTTSQGKTAIPAWLFSCGDFETVGGTAGVQRTMDVASGTMSFWYKHDIGSPAQVDIVVRVDGVVKLSTNTSVGALGGGAWQQLSFSVSSATAAVVQIEVYSFGGGGWIDDISIPVP